ncbi:HNH endonuclease [Xanthobacter flavus]|uniref:HNH endonuclease n=1 Tax=Xanthobacter flavus TaxID=281 RepID=UPI0037283179
MSMIAAALRELMAAGLTGDELVAAVARIEAEMAVSVPPARSSAAAERKREADRERMRFRRQECSLDDWLSLCAAVFARDGFACVYCGSGDEPLHCDQILPLSRGGRSVIENLATACAPCNISKGGRTPDEWAARCL